MPKRFYIIDGHSQIHRAFHARMAPLRSPEGEPTKATYVFTRALLKLLREHKPDFIVMACDAGRHKLHRRKVYPDYKADRGPADKDLVVQLARCKQIVHRLGIPVIEAEGWEADDIIATLVDYVKDIADVVIISRDKDLMQLVGPNVRMYEPIMSEWVGTTEVYAKWGVVPKRVVEVQVLCGDPGDNVPGIYGIGPKTAAKLIRKYRSVKKVFKNLEDLPTGVQNKIVDCKYKKIAKRNRKLVSLCRDVPIGIDARSMRWRGLDLTNVRAIFKQLGFKRWE